MKSEDILSHISSLVEQEHKLLEAGNSAELDKVQVELDQYWDLLRRRRAAQAYDGDPDEVELRDEETVEGYRPYRR